MNELTIKNVDFLGDTLVAAQDRDGNIWAAVKWMCDGIGLTEGQRQRQTTNIKEDIVLKKGVANLQLPTNGGNQEVLCLQLSFIPLWLAKISITPAMQSNNPRLVEKLIEYQLKAKDVLAAAFLPTYNTTYQYPVSAATGAAAAELGRVTERIMKAQGSAPYKIAAAFQLELQQLGLELPADFVEIPVYQQLSFFEQIVTV